MDDLLLPIPGVTVSKAFGFPAYKITGKVFVFVAGKGVSIKVPQPRVAELIESDSAIHPFEMENGLVWKSWITVLCDDAEDYARFLDIFEEAAAYVAE